MRNWQLPAHIEDILPPEAQRVESLRGRLLELFRTRGYQVVMPPLLEYVDSLCVGTGVDLDLRTFKLVDQLSGRQMGVRADITPQVARIDAYLAQREGVAHVGARREERAAREHLGEHDARGVEGRATVGPEAQELLGGSGIAKHDADTQVAKDTLAQWGLVLR